MASTSIPINVAVLASATTLYTAFDVGGASTAMLVSLDLTNTTAGDLTIDVWYEKDSDSSKKYLASTLTVPALGTASWRGLAVINASADMWRAQASATGIDAVGGVVENA